MKTLNGLPVYKMTINEDDTLTGVEFLSLVDFPAIEVNWVAFSKNKIKLYASEQDKQILVGPAMIPDLPIYRADAELGEYYVTFDSAEIERIANKFMKEQNTLAINYQHQDNSQVSGAVIVESWFITDTQNDKSNVYGFNLPVGTWMVSTKIENSDFWNNEIKSGNVRGYSIEGYLNLEMAKIKNKQDNKMSKIKMNAEIKTTDGVMLYTDGDAFVEGANVYTVDSNGNQVPATDGDYVLENGVTITIASGKITVVADPSATPAATSQNAEFQLTPEDIQTIMDQLAPALKPLADQITALEARIIALETANMDMKTAMSKIPGSGISTSNTDNKDKFASTKSGKMTLADKVEILKNLKKK